MKFRVIDNKTGKYADPYEIALFEEWAQGFCYCYIDGFAILEDGKLLIVDDSGHYVYCDSERFKVVLEDESPHGEWIWKKDEDALRTYDLLCSECGYKTFTCENYDNLKQAKKDVDDRIREGKTLFPFCPNCGAKMRKEGESDEDN